MGRKGGSGMMYAGDVVRTWGNAFISNVSRARDSMGQADLCNCGEGLQHQRRKKKKNKIRCLKYFMTAGCD